MRKRRYASNLLGWFSAALCLLGVPGLEALAQHEPLAASAQEQPSCSTWLRPLTITIANDSDVDLDIVAPQAFRTYVNPGDPSAPESPEVITKTYNGRAVSVISRSGDSNMEEVPQLETHQPLSERLCQQDVLDMEHQTLYAHSQYTFYIRRLSLPANLFLKFRLATEEPYGDYEVARWEYAEGGGAADAACNLEASRLQFTIGCSGNNNINAPVMNVRINHINKAVVPRPLNYGADPGAGPPSTP